MKQHSRGLSFARRLLLVAVAILALAQPATAAIKANLEYPSQSFPASGIGNIQGWAFSTFSNATIDPLIEVKIDSEPSFYVPCCSTRQDVKQAYSTAPVHSGFSGVTNFQRLSEGSHTIAVTIRSSALEKKTIKSTFKVVKLSPWARLDSFRWKQSPKAQCESLEGLDPAYGNAGAVCNHSRAVSTHPKKLVTDCDGTIQFAFDRSRQTFAPITGCDPQGVVTPGGGG